MSNRNRREWLLRVRVKQIRQSELGDDLDEFLERYPDDGNGDFRKDYLHFVRTTFAEISRPPLKFQDRRSGMDSLGGQLAVVQARNALQPFNLLSIDLQDVVVDASICRLWPDYSDHFEAASRAFDRALEMLSRHRRVRRRVLSSEAAPDWVAPIQKAVRTLRGSRKAVFQYEDRFPSVLGSAQRFWPECRGLEDSDVFALLAADQACISADILLDLVQDFDWWALEDGIGRTDDQRLSTLRMEMSEHEREQSRHGLRKLQRSRELLNLAQLAELAKESSLARLRLEEQEREFIQREAVQRSLIERGKAFSHCNGSGRRGLWLVVETILNNLGWDASAEDVWKVLKDYEGNGVIDEVTDDEVFWLKDGASSARSTKWNSFKSQLSTTKTRRKKNLAREN